MKLFVIARTELTSKFEDQNILKIHVESVHDEKTP